MPHLTSPLLRLLRTPAGAALMVAGLIAKLPASMLALSLVLVVADRFDRALAGWMVTALALGLAVTGPWRGRAVDRYGPRIVLLVLGSAHTLALVTLSVSAPRADSFTPLLVLAFLTGATSTPVMPVLRASWQRLGLVKAQADAAQAWESVSIDIAFVVSPSLVALAAGVQGPAILLPMIATITVVTTVLLAVVVGRSWARSSHPGRLDRLPKSMQVWRVVLVSAFTGAAISAAELGAVGVAEDVGEPAVAGLLIAALSATSIVGGLFYGHRRPVGGDRSHLVVAATVWILGMVIAATFHSRLAGAAAGLALAGLGLAVLMTAQYQIAGAAAPAECQTEMFAWMATASQIGLATGAAAAGYLQSDHALVLSATAALLALLTSPPATPATNSLAPTSPPAHG